MTVKVIRMIGIIGKIAVLLGISRDGKSFERRKRRPVGSRRESDTVTISSEARLLLDRGGDRGSSADEAGLH
jgi:hypothetical protein